ncbi:MAG: DUF2179 domain-containing protein [Candidatus Cloacimonadia bacterium]
MYTWVVLPLLIFLARVCDVSIGTVRIIFVARGKRLLAPLLGFFEILIWLLAIQQVMQNLTNILCYLAYAGGFAAGTFVGMVIEEHLAIGMVVIRIITQQSADELVSALKEQGCGVTIVDAKGARGKVKIIYSVINRRDIDEIVNIIKRYNPKAFYTIEDVREAYKGVFPERQPSREYRNINILRKRRKEKL